MVFWTQYGRSTLATGSRDQTVILCDLADRNQARGSVNVSSSRCGSDARLLLGLAVLCVPRNVRFPARLQRSIARRLNLLSGCVDVVPVVIRHAGQEVLDGQAFLD